MQQITYLQLCPSRRLYNDIVRRALKQAGIQTDERSKPYGIQVWVLDSDYDKALRIVLAIPHNKPKYEHIKNYIK